MAQKDSPIVEATGYLNKIKKLAESPVQDENKRDQIMQCADATLELLSQIEQVGKEGSRILTGEQT